MILFVLFFILSGCNKYYVEPEPIPSPVVTPMPSPSFSPGFVTFSPVKNYATKEQATKIERAGALMNEVVQSQCSSNFLAKRKMIQTNGRTSQQVVDHLKSLKGDIPVVMYYRCMNFSVFKCPSPTSAVAYRNPPELTINLNSAAFDVSDSDCDWAETMAHESLGHSLGGYDHDYEWNSARSFSVPYSLGGADDVGGSVFQNCCTCSGDKCQAKK